MKEVSERERERRKKLSRYRITHGKSYTSEYHTWKCMWQRCTNKQHPCYHLYGGRGIGVAPEWRTFERFISDMGNKPSPKHSLERKNNSIGYSKENCVWATQHEQTRNTRRNLNVEIGEEIRCMKDWCLHFGVSYSVVMSRIRRGSDPIKALLTRNVSRIIRVKLYGETRCLSDWCSHLGVPYGVISSRVRRGQPPVEALLEPIKTRKHKPKDRNE